MTFDEKKQSAQIIAKLYENDEVEMHLNGSGFDLVSLSLSIARQMIIRGLIDINDYCDALRAGTPSKTEVDDAIKKLIDDTFLN